MMSSRSSSVRWALVVVALFGVLAVACSKQASARTGGTVTVREGPGNGYTFAPSTVTVNRGQTITVDNVSQIPHTFTVTGRGIDVETQPGQACGSRSTCLRGPTRSSAGSTRRSA